MNFFLDNTIHPKNLQEFIVLINSPGESWWPLMIQLDG